MNRKKALEQHAQGPICFAVLLWGILMGMGSSPLQNAALEFISGFLDIAKLHVPN